MGHLSGLVLAGGRGERFGGPKALAVSDDGLPWLTRVCGTLAEVVDDVIAVIPAGLSEARALAPAGVRVVDAPVESTGLSDSLRAGIQRLDDRTRAVVITTVDLPLLPVEAVRRVVGSAHGASVLRRAVYDGRPGHPVLIGREHWPALIASLGGDTGAGRYLRAHGAETVECGDLFDGQDTDTR
ncbi:NTP transferase domain-containing protein [Amnibacterium flavum]|uniref:MobA-like NTP transferase domain-containing protein n=1 Tax=Amnibacterium flavum TaxID=2173173 RepID=A0A2V1HWT4_9MICO|nr:nucleotidyltransferase family protein [Amnibacterium flavum]PVZ95650.1 hypothetical protein DDQ50_03980 [Amnibacterium flavum]